ncbi:MAG: YihY/virulence factor BrkB family protein [Gemmatimonadota bacterium]|nr:YihY/virulence factor BrkB family protein [Gemmatimonadota bacterium]
MFFLASGLTFSLLLAAIPFLLLVVAAAGAILAPTLNVPPEVALDWLAGLLPVSESVRRDVWATILDLADVSRSASPISALLFVWFSTRLFGALRTALDDVFDLRHGVGVLAAKLRDLQVVLVASLLLLANVGITTTFLAMSRRVLSRTPIPPGPALTLLGYLTALGAIFLMFLLIYKFVPTVSLGWRTATVAAGFASVGFELVKYGLGLYLTEVADFTRVFSAFATLVLVVVSFYYVAILFILGAEVAKVHAYQRVMRVQREVFDPA